MLLRVGPSSVSRRAFQTTGRPASTSTAGAALRAGLEGRGCGSVTLFAKGRLAWAAQAILFDLDGVLVDSRECVRHVWEAWAAKHGFDACDFLKVAHGRRTRETLRLVSPTLDIAREVAVLDRMEETEIRGLRPLAGALELLTSLPANRWGIVTSGSLKVATLRLDVAGLPRPRVFVTGEEVTNGKPDPEGFLAAAAALGAKPQECLVLEDAPPGVAAAKAAGMTVVAVLTTHERTHLKGADAFVRDLNAIAITSTARQVTVTFTT